MSSPESWGDIFSDIKIDPPPPEEIYANIIGRNNAIAATMGEEHYQVMPEVTAELSIGTPGYGNSLVLIVPGSRSIPIGYFSPVSGEYVTYPELVNLLEHTALMSPANEARLTAIEQFTLQPPSGGSRVEYYHPALQYLHETLNRMLTERDLALGITYKHNLYSDTLPHQQINIDEATAMAVCLRPAYVDSRYLPGRKISIMFLGSFCEVSGAKRRHYDVRHIDIALRGANEEGMNFEPITDKYDDPIVSFGELDRFVEMAALVDGVNLPNFCSESVGFKIEAPPAFPLAHRRGQ